MAKRPKPITIGSRRTTSEKVEAAIGRAEKSDRIMSLTAAQSVIGVDRGTLARWIKKGCPVIAGGGSGKAIQVDLREVWAWREEMVRREEREKFIRIDETDPSASPLDVDAQIQIETLKSIKIKTAERTGLLVMSPIAAQTFAEALGAIRQAVMAVPDRTERSLSGFPPDLVRGAKDEIVVHCRSALDDAQATMDDCVRKLTRRRLAELGIEPDADWDDETPDDEEDGDGEE